MISFFLTSIFYLLSLAWAPPTMAQEEFTVSYSTTYTVQDDGQASVVQEITLLNNFSKIYADSYTLLLEGKKPKDIQILENGNVLPGEITEEENATKITVRFPDALVGRGKSRTFRVGYSLSGIATQNGEVWDVVVPKLASPENIDNYNLTLKIPIAFGDPAYISPEPIERSKSGEFQNFIFKKDDLVKAGVVGAFGQFQSFSFTLNYHLENPLSGLGQTEIALPPDTAFQRMFYTQILPKPQKIRLDEDGNWLAVYELDSRERLDVVAIGNAQVFAKPQKFYPKTISNSARYLVSTHYWNADDPQIKNIAQSLKTPRAIYDFVTRYLTYDYARVREGVERLGAAGALQNPTQAICMEFTDLFIALSRAAGIPAREINGYAYTENPEVQPLSLIADVLHAWPEYWDEEIQAWRPVDPTWENTTGGIDFFDKFDLSHIAFAIHGTDPNLPLPAGSYKFASNPQKDVDVQFSKIPEVTNSKPLVNSILPKIVWPFISTPIEVEVYNPGPTALYDFPIKIITEGLETGTSGVQNISFLAPFDKTSFTIPARSPLWNFLQDKKVLILANDESFEYNIYTGQPEQIAIAAVFSILLLVLIGLLGLRFLPRLITVVKWLIFKKA